MAKKGIIQAPMGETKVLLHTCCAPCSSAIIEALLQNGITPVIYYCNPNIFPKEEYDIRKNECTRYAQSLGLEIVDADYDHESWLEAMSGLEAEPERGGRCLKCFKVRLLDTARYAMRHGIRVITTTLASSRWKSLDQINEAGRWACEQVARCLEDIDAAVAPITGIDCDGMPLGAVGSSRLGVESSPVLFPPVSEISGRISAVPSASARCPEDIDAAVAPITGIDCDGMPLGAVGFSRLGVESSPVLFPPVTEISGRISAVPSASARCPEDIDAAVAPITGIDCDGMPLGAVGSSRLGVESSPVLFPPIWWEQNWRKGGLQERRLQIIKEYDFYNQLYCGCEFSMRKDV